MRFVLFDRIVALEKGQHAVFLKNVSHSEDYFTDHFPGYPIVPGSIILGSFEQGAEILLGASCDFSLRPVLRRFSKARFRRFVVPGDQLHISLVIEASTPATVRASARVQEQEVVSARLDFYLEKPEENPRAGEACERLRLFYQLLGSGPLSKAWDLWERQA